jgi:hypothetical protein
MKETEYSPALGTSMSGLAAVCKIPPIIGPVVSKIMSMFAGTTWDPTLYAYP